MYDKFKLDLTSTQVLIGTTIEETRAKLSEKASNFHLVDKINVDFLVETCIVPKGTSLTRFRISGHMPVLKANISDQKYKSLMKVIDFAIPKFGDDKAAKKIEPKAENGAALQPTKTDEDRRGSFTFAAQRHELVMEEESVAGDGEQEFKDAKPSADQVPLQMHTKNFELKFKPS